MRIVELGSGRLLRPGPLISLRGLLWLVLLSVAVVGALAIVAYAILYGGAWLTGTDASNPKTVPGAVKATGFILGSLAAACAYAGAVRLGEGRWPAELNLRRMLPEVGLGLAIGGASMAVIVFIMWQAGWVTISARPVTKILSAIGTSVESGTVEEIVFRLILLRLLWRVLGAWPALIVSSAVFGAIHLTNPDATVLGALGVALEGGLLASAMYMLTGRIWLSIGDHAGWNFMQGWILGASVSGAGGGFPGGPLSTQPVPGVPEALSGGAFGPEETIVAMIVSTLLGLIALWFAWRKGRMANGVERVAAG